MTEENFKFTREWFQDKKNQVHTRQDIDLFNDRQYPKENIIEIGEHFLVDLIPVDNKCSDVEIWEVENTKKKHSVLRRGKLPLRPIRKITTGKQFGFPNGYWRVPENIEQLIATPSDSASQVVNDGLNINLKTTPSAPSKLPTATSLNNNIPRLRPNFKFHSKALK